MKWGRGEGTCYSLGTNVPRSGHEGVFPHYTVSISILHFQNLNKWVENHRHLSSPTSLSIYLYDTYNTETQNNLFFKRFVVFPLLNWTHLRMWNHREYLLIAPQSGVNPKSYSFVQYSWQYTQMLFSSLIPWRNSPNPSNLSSGEGDRLSTGNPSVVNVLREGYRSPDPVPGRKVQGSGV